MSFSRELAAGIHTTAILQCDVAPGGTATVDDAELIVYAIPTG